MKQIGQVLSFCSLYTLIFIFTPSVGNASEYKEILDSSANQNNIIKILDKQINRAQRKSTPMSKYTNAYKRKYERQMRKLERNMRKSLRRNQDHIIREKLVSYAQNAGADAQTINRIQDKSLDIEKDIIDVYFSKENKESIKQNQLLAFANYEYLADYLSDVKRDILSETQNFASKYFSKAKVRMPANAVGFFLTFIFGGLIACLGGLIGLIFPLAGMIILLIGTAMILGASTWAILND